MSFRGFLWLLAGLTPVYLVLAAVLPPADDEVYYWCWSQQLQLSYYDHPPMTAYLIRAATTLFGDTLFAIRLPAVVSTLTVLAVIGWLTRPRTLLPLVLFTPLFTFGAVLVTPDTPLLMFWALYLAWLVRTHEKLASRRRQSPELTEKTPGSRRRQSPELTEKTPATDGAGSPGILWWALGGVLLGCGILGKYTTGLGMIAGFASFLIAGQPRRWILGYMLHGGVAVVVTLPILVHNFRYDFAPLMYQWKHSMSSPEPGWMPFLSFFGIQALLFGLMPFAVFVWTASKWRELFRNPVSAWETGFLPATETRFPKQKPGFELFADPRLRVCACLFAIPFAFFLYKATRGHLEGNWALAMYISAWPLAAVMLERARNAVLARKLAWGSFAVPAACVLLLAVHLVHPIAALAPAADRITRQWSKDDLARQLAASISRSEPIYTTSYQWTALLRFHQIDAHQIDGVTRPSHFTQHSETLAGRERVVVFAEGYLPVEFVEGFGPPRIVGRFPLVVRGEEVGILWLIEYVKPGHAERHAALQHR